METLKLYLYFLIFLFGFIVLNMYVYFRIKKYFSVNNKYFKVIYIILGLMFPFSFLIAKFVEFKYSFYLLWTGNFWLGVLFLGLFLFIFADLMFFVAQKTVKSEFSNKRRKFISDGFKLMLLTSWLTEVGMGLKNYYNDPIIKKIDIKIKNLPDSFKGFKIAQISDIHIGQLATKKTLETIVKQVNSLNPDIVAITGDLADGSTGFLFDEIKPLENLKSKYGVYFVTGNHEYYSGIGQWIIALRKLKNIKILNNESIKLEINKEKIYLIGVNDREGIKYAKCFVQDFEKAFSKVPEESVKILLNHQPADLEEAAAYNCDLVLSGHTHGGQIWPFGYIVEAQQKYLKGHFKYKNTQLYVNQGTGCWGPPLRLQSRNEITLITLI